MVCCFMNFHEKENAKNLLRHFDGEIDNAISRGCDTFIAGNKYPEDILFAESVATVAKEYPNKDIKVILVEPRGDYEKNLKDFFICIADWEIYSHYVEY